MSHNKLLLNSEKIDLITNRICHQLIENHNDFKESVLLGIQPRGIYFGNKLHENLENIIGSPIQYGYLDVTFYRDDFRRNEQPLNANQTKVDFIIENKKVVLIDDVLYTGRTIRAALDAMMAFGRPKLVELIVLIDRKYTRELPIEATYIGKKVDSLQSEKVKIEWKEQGFKKNSCWLINKI